MTTLTHRAPFQPVIVNVTITIRLDALFWLIYAAVWLAWLPFDWLRTRPVVRLGRWVREWWTAAGYGIRQAPGMMLEDWGRFWFKAGWNYAL